MGVSRKWEYYCGGGFAWSLRKIAKLAETTVVGRPHDDVVEDLDFEELPGPDQIARDLDVRLGWGGIAAYAACGITGVMPHPVLCRM